MEAGHFIATYQVDEDYAVFRDVVLLKDLHGLNCGTPSRWCEKAQSVWPARFRCAFRALTQHGVEKEDISLLDVWRQLSQYERLQVLHTSTAARLAP